MNTKKIINKTIIRWADKIGIVSISSQQRLSEMLLTAIEEHQSVLEAAQAKKISDLEAQIKELEMTKK